MSSFSTAGGGEKATTFVLPNKKGDQLTAATSTGFLAGVNTYAYVTSGIKTALSVTGSGHMSFSAFESNSTSATATVKITVDGIVVLNDTQTRNISSTTMQQVGSFAYNGTYAVISRDRLVFKKSLLVEVSCNVFATYNYDYYLN